MKATKRVDGLSKGPQILAWMGIALTTYLVVVLACVLTDTPTLGKMGGLWVILLATAGYAGSTNRNRNRNKGLT